MSANVTVLKDELGLDREYREVEREACVGERVIIVNSVPYGYYGYVDGEIYEVLSLEGDGTPNIVPKNPEGDDEGEVYLEHDEYLVLEPTDIIRIDGERFRLVERVATVGERVLEPLGSAPEQAGVSELVRKSREQQAQIDGLTETIANLARRLTELEMRVAELVCGQAPKETPEPIINKALTRDAIVERAKAELSDLRKFEGTDLPEGDGISFWPKVNGSTRYIPMHKVKFVVNRKKRTVVALIEGGVNALHFGYFSRGIAKCAPNDCFNVHIGQAIALRRALGLDIPPEYVNAPQPEEPQVGDVVEKNVYWLPAGLKGIVEQVGGDFNPRNPSQVYVGGHLGLTFFDENGEHVWADKRHVRILDDSRDGRIGEVYSF